MKKEHLFKIHIVIIFTIFIPIIIHTTNVGGIIDSDTTWTINNSPYIVVSNILVSENVTLTIQAGVQIKFNDYYIYIDGTLVAIGDSDNWIHFTSNQSIPQSKDWKEIKFRDKSEDAVFDEQGNYITGCIMRYCIVEYGRNLASGIRYYQLIAGDYREVKKMILLR